MKKQPFRSPFSLLLSANEKLEIEKRSRAMGLSANAYIRFMIFQPQQTEIISTRSPQADNSIPEINVKVYRSLCDIADSLRKLAKRVANNNPINLNPVKVDSVLLEKTLDIVKKVGLQIASNKN